MLMKKFLCTFSFLVVAGVAFTTIVSAQDHYLVELENRTPDVQAMVQAYEGTSSIPFQANDISGEQQSLLEMTGKTVILWFWNNDCPLCHKQITDMNMLAQKYAADLQIVSFSDNTKEEIISFTATHPVDFPIVPNSKTLAEGPYGGDLGYPKIFILDKNGKIKWAIPEVEMRGDFNTFNFLETLHVSLSK